MSTALPDLSVLIVSYEVRDLLRACLDALPHACSGLRWEAIVVDNDSADGSAQMVADHFPEVRLFRNDTNRGFPAAVNRALALARGRNVALLNPDTRPWSHSLARLSAHVDTHGGMAGPQILHADGTRQPSVLCVPGLWSLACDWLGLSRLFPRSSWLNPGQYGRRTFAGAIPADGYLQGSCVVLRRYDLEALGGLDEDLWWAEDVDLALRLRGLTFSPLAVWEGA